MWGCHTSWNCELWVRHLWAAVSVLGIESGSSGRRAGALNHWNIFSTLNVFSRHNSLCVENMGACIYCFNYWWKTVDLLCKYVDSPLSCRYRTMTQWCLQWLWMCHVQILFCWGMYPLLLLSIVLRRLITKACHLWHVALLGKVVTLSSLPSSVLLQGSLVFKASIKKLALVLDFSFMCVFSENQS